MKRELVIKKIVSGSLSAAEITLILLTMTACASKGSDTAESDTAQIKPVLAETLVAEETNIENTDTESSMTIEEWIDSEEAVIFVKAFNNVYAKQGITMELEAENNTLSMILIYSEEALETDTADLTDEQKEEVHEMMQKQYDEIKEQIIAKGNILKEEVGVSTIHIGYRTSSGTELFSQDL